MLQAVHGWSSTYERLVKSQKFFSSYLTQEDLSRFGREYIEAGRWIEKIYPALNVRFISVTDQFDSNTADFSEKSFVVPVKNFLNESYCRDISGKVRSHQKIKREKGEFIGAFAPYGYCKDSGNKNRLVVDAEAADVVRKIFAWKMEGFSLGAIAEKLNERQVLSPKAYKKANGENYNSGFVGTDTPKWSAVQIKRILVNEVYIGNLVQGKQERISYKVKKRLNKPEAEWARVKDTHPAIIKQSEFEVVQKLLQYDGRASKTEEHASFFSSFVFCGDCGTPMIRRVNRYKDREKAFYICQTKNKGGACTRHSVSEEVLKKIVLKEIQIYTALFADYERIMDELRKMRIDYEQVVHYDMQIAKLQSEYSRYYGLRASLYDDLKEGLLSKEEFDEFRESYGKKCEELNRRIEKQKELVKQMFENGVSAAVQLEDWKKSLELKELDRILLALTVDKINVYENKRLEIHLRYEDTIEKLKIIKQFYEIQQTECGKEVG